MEVKILTYTQEPVETIYRAYKQCYAPGTATEIKIPSYEEMAEFIEKWGEKGHLSPWEHVSFTFSVEGVSRALTHQLVRHRIASYNQQSQRYIRGENFDFVMPNLSYIEDDTRRYVAKKFLNNVLQNVKTDYKTLIDLGLKKEDARCILPNATTSNIIVTMNLRAFRHFYEERSCFHAQAEIRELANKMMDLVKEIVPFADYKAKKCGITCFECTNK